MARSRAQPCVNCISTSASRILAQPRGRRWAARAQHKVVWLQDLYFALFFTYGYMNILTPMFQRTFDISLFKVARTVPQIVAIPQLT